LTIATSPPGTKSIVVKVSELIRLHYATITEARFKRIHDNLPSKKKQRTSTTPFREVFIDATEPNAGTRSSELG
jgi:hypothetical protein